jgi:hypothetical protein
MQFDRCSFSYVSFGGLVVIVLAIGLSSAGSNPAENDRYLRAIKIHSTTFFGGKVKPSFPHPKILTEYLKSLYV